jgi:hypothetical protein
MGRAMPSSYLALEKAVSAQAKTKVPPVMTWAEYRDLARLSLIEESGDDLRTATTLLHNLGSLVHFPNEEKVRQNPPLVPWRDAASVLT